MKYRPDTVVSLIRSAGAQRLASLRWEYVSQIREQLGMRADPRPANYLPGIEIIRGDPFTRIEALMRELGRTHVIAADVTAIAAGNEPLWEQSE